MCDYFLLCENEPDGFADNPILGPVKTCQRCADKVGVDIAVEYYRRNDNGSVSLVTLQGEHTYDPDEIEGV